MKKIFTVLTLSLILSGCTFFPKQDVPKIPLTEKETAIQKAQELFSQKQKEGIGLTDGPCLSNELMPDWVVDIAHQPRQPIDDLPENQCSAYNNGIAHHFVELDVSGKLIGAE